MAQPVKVPTAPYETVAARAISFEKDLLVYGDVAAPEAGPPPPPRGGPGGGVAGAAGHNDSEFPPTPTLPRKGGGRRTPRVEQCLAQDGVHAPIAVHNLG